MRIQDAAVPRHTSPEPNSPYSPGVFLLRGTLGPSVRGHLLLAPGSVPCPLQGLGPGPAEDAAGRGVQGCAGEPGAPCVLLLPTSHTLWRGKRAGDRLSF